MDSKTLLKNKQYTKNPDRIIPTKISSSKPYYHMMEVAAIAQDSIEKAEKRTTMDVTARFLDSIAYVLVHHWDKLQDPNTRLGNFCVMCATVNAVTKTTDKLMQSRAELKRQTGYEIEDGDFVEPVK